MAAGRIVIPGWMPALDSNGVPIANARMFFYQNNTTTLATVYSDQTLTTPLTNPIVANASGQWPSVWADTENLFSVTVDANYGPAGVPFTFDDVSPSNSAGGGGGGGGGINRGAWNASTNSPVIVSGEGEEGDFYTVTVSGSAVVDGIGSWVQGDQILFKTGVWTKVPSTAGTSYLYTTLEEHGGRANDSTFDNSAAFAAAEAYLTARMTSEPGFKGVLMLRGAVDYYFKDTLLMKRTGGVWIGDRTRLIYNGASTTKDLIVFGHYNGGEPLAGKPQTRDVYVEGIQVLSLTAMTAGWAIRTRSCIESTFKLELQTQTGYEAYGNNLYNGLWNEWSATVVYEGVTFIAKNKVIAINGAPGGSGGKSDAWFDIGKIAGGQLGCHIGGAFGGIWFSTRTTFIANKKHVLENQALTAENNREVMYKGATFDYTQDLLGGPADVGIDIAGPGECYHDFIGCWIAGQFGAAVIVRDTSNAFVNMSGNRFFNIQASTLDPTLDGSAVVTDSVAARIFVNGGQANAIPGYVFRSRVAGHNLNFADVHLFNCPAGPYDPTFVSTTDTSFRPLSGATWTRSGWFDNNVVIGANVDQGYSLSRLSGNPVINFDSTDYLEYLRASNLLNVRIGGSTPLVVSQTGIGINGTPPIFPVYISGTLDGSGTGSGSFGVPQANVLYGFVSVLDGAPGPYGRVIQVQTNGSSYLVPGDASVAGKPYKGLVWCLS